MSKLAMIIGAGALSVGVALTLAGAGNQIEPGQKVPVINIASSNGKKLATADLLKKGDFMLLFLGVDCPATPQAEPTFSKMVKVYGEKNRMFVVMDTDQAGYAAFKKKAKTSFTVGFDPKKSTIRAFDVQSGPTVVWVNKDGKVEKVWAGYSQKIYAEINEAMAGLAGTKPAELDLSKAPKNTRFG